MTVPVSHESDFCIDSNALSLFLGDSCCMLERLVMISVPCWRTSSGVMLFSRSRSATPSTSPSNEQLFLTPTSEMSCLSNG